MYDQRVNFGLEQPAVFDLPPFPSVYTCSEETQDAASFLLDGLYEGLDFTLDLINMEDYLLSISEWIEDFNTPADPTPRRRGFNSWADL